MAISKESEGLGMPWKDAADVRECREDHLILCMEGRLPYEVKIDGNVQTLFTARNTNKRAKGYLGRSLALGSDLLRRTWLVNLQQTVLP